MKPSFAVGWRQVGASAVIMACATMVSTTYGIIAVPLAQEFHPSRMVLMLAMTIMALGSGVAAPILGNLMDKIAPRRLMGIGAAALVGGYLALSMVTSFIQVMIVFGLFFAVSNILAGPIAATVLLSRWFDQRRGRALGLAISGVAAGSVLFPPLIQFLLDSFAWRDALRVLALILLVCTGVAVALLVNRPEDRGLHADGAEDAAHAARAAVTPPTAPALSTREILSDPSFWLFTGVFTTVSAGMLGMVTNVVPMSADFGIDARAGALLVSVYAVTGFIAKLGFAAFADRVNPRVLMFGLLALFAAGMVCLAEANNGYAVMLIGSALVGCGGMMLPLQGFLVPRMFGLAVVGRVSGLLSLIALCGALVTPPLFGRIYDQTGSYAAVFLALAGIAVATMLLVPRIRLHPRGGPADDTADARDPQPRPAA